MGTFTLGRRNARLVAASFWGALSLAGCNHLLEAPKSAMPPSLKEDSPSKSAQADGYMRQGRQYEKRGEWAQAMIAYRQAAKSDPLRAEAYRRQAVVCDHLGDYQKAAVLYETALKFKPDDADLHCDFGYSLYLQGRWKESEKNLLRSLELKHDHAAARNNLAVLYVHTGRPELAKAEFRKAGCTAFQAQAKVTAVLASGHPANAKAKAPKENDLLALRKKKPATHATAAKPSAKPAKEGVRQAKHETQVHEPVAPAVFDDTESQPVRFASLDDRAETSPSKNSEIVETPEPEHVAETESEPAPPMLELPVENPIQPASASGTSQDLHSRPAETIAPAPDENVIAAAFVPASIPAASTGPVARHWIYDHLGWLAGVLAAAFILAGWIRWRGAIHALLRGRKRCAGTHHPAGHECSTCGHVADAERILADKIKSTTLHVHPAARGYSVHFVPFQQ